MTTTTAPADLRREITEAVHTAVLGILERELDGLEPDTGRRILARVASDTAQTAGYAAYQIRLERDVVRLDAFRADITAAIAAAGWPEACEGIAVGILRRYAGWSQADTARVAERDRHTVARWEAGRPIRLGYGPARQVMASLGYEVGPLFTVLGQVWDARPEGIRSDA